MGPTQNNQSSINQNDPQFKFLEVDFLQAQHSVRIKFSSLENSIRLNLNDSQANFS